MLATTLAKPTCYATRSILSGSGDTVVLAFHETRSPENYRTRPFQPLAVMQFEGAYENIKTGCDLICRFGRAEGFTVVA